MLFKYEAVQLCLVPECLERKKNDLVTISVRGFKKLPLGLDAMVRNSQGKYANCNILILLKQNLPSDFKLWVYPELRFSDAHFMNNPTSFAIAPGTPCFCIHNGSEPLASLAVAIVHSIF